MTEVDRLKADPFAFYARRILRVSAIDPVDADPSPAWRGSAVHTVLEAWMKEDDCDPAKLRPRAESLFSGSAAHPLLRALWQPRLIEAIEFIAGQVERDRATGRHPAAAEVRGSLDIAGVRLDGRADRIDRLPDGSLAIIDYKTGKPPSAKAIDAGFSLQLGLLGLMLERGAFEELNNTPSHFEYWSLAKKSGVFGYVWSPTADRDLTADQFMADAERHFIAAVETWLTGTEPFSAKLRPEYAPYREYDQLMRLEEWYGREG